MSHIHRFHVYFGDTDAAGIVYYPNFYRWMDQASHELFKEKDLSPSKLQSEKNIIIPLVEAKCQFKRALFYEDEVEIHSKVIEIKNKVLKIEHRFLRGEEEVAAGYEIRIWTSKQNDRLRAEPVPDDVIKILQD